jgi:hypothetical protein
MELGPSLEWAKQVGAMKQQEIQQGGGEMEVSELAEEGGVGVLAVRKKGFEEWWATKNVTIPHWSHSYLCSHNLGLFGLCGCSR